MAAIFTRDLAFSLSTSTKMSASFTNSLPRESSDAYLTSGHSWELERHTFGFAEWFYDARLLAVTRGNGSHFSRV